MPRPLPIPAPPDRRRFRQRLLTWYRRHGRDLPWRKTDDPYHILVSEIMLQQTQVDRVLPKYHEWLEKYPSLEALAAAPIRDVARVLYRTFVGTGDPKSHAMKRHLWAVSEALVPMRHVFDFNQALMDFGAMVCVARKPRCLVCPMAKDCAWRRLS